MAEVSTPRTALVQNRTAALAFGLTTAVAFGFFNGVGFSVSTTLSLDAPTGPVYLLAGAFGGAMVGGFVGYVAYRWVGAIAFGLAGAVVTGLTFTAPAGLLHGDMAGLAYGIVFGLAAGLVAILSRAWGCLMVCRIWLTVHGCLPWRLMRFLDDAHRRDVFRQSGAMYEFRHAKFRNHLANTHDQASDLVDSET
jgi:hypothetical protein